MQKCIHISFVDSSSLILMERPLTSSSSRMSYQVNYDLFFQFCLLLFPSSSFIDWLRLGQQTQVHSTVGVLVVSWSYYTS